jgi:putative iron-only hydrogenase system regulator
MSFLAIIMWEEKNMRKIAVISAILEEPDKCQKEFNEIVSNYKQIIKGRMGIPFDEAELAVICIMVMGELDEINGFTGKLGKLEHVLVKTSFSKKEIL